MDIINQVNKFSSLLDILLNVEDYLDSLDLYAFKNWFHGEVVAGPYVKRYWIVVTLKYPYKLMPDPKGAKRIMKYGSKVKYERAFEEVPKDPKSSKDADPHTGKPKFDKRKIWLIHLQIPRKFIEERYLEELETVDAELESFVGIVGDSKDEERKNDE